MRGAKILAAGVMLALLLGMLIGGYLGVCKYVFETTPEKYLQEKVAEEPANVEERIKLFSAFQDSGKTAEAIVTLQEGLRIAPNDPVLLKTLALAYEDWAAQTDDKTKVARAAKYWQRLIDSGASSSGYRLQLATDYIECDQPQRAIPICEELLRNNPGDADVLFTFGRALKNAGKYERALSILTEATLLAPKEFDSWSWLATTQEALGDYDAAVLNMKKAYELCPEDWKNSIRRHVAYAEVLAEKNPSQRCFETHFYFARSCEKEEGREDRAAAEYEACLSLVPPNKNRDVHNQCGFAHDTLARFYKYAGETQHALEHALAAINEYAAIENVNQLGFSYQRLAGIYATMAIQFPERQRELLEKAKDIREKELQAAQRARNEHLARHALSENAYALFQLNGLEDPQLKQLRGQMRLIIDHNEPKDCSYACIFVEEGYLLFQDQNYSEAEKVLKRVRTQFEKSNSMDDIRQGPTLLVQLAFLAARRNDLDSAIECCEAAIARLTFMRNLLNADEFRRQVGGETWEVTFNNLLEYCWRKNDMVAAFNYCEQYKARALMDLLGSKADEKRAAQRIPSANERYSGGEASTEAIISAPDFGSNTRDFEVEETSIKRLPEDTATANLQVPSFVNATPFPIEELKPLTDDFNLITYFIGQDNFFAFVLTKNSLRMIKLYDGAESTLKDEIQAFLVAIGIKPLSNRDLGIETSGKPMPVSDSTQLDALSRQLYEQLIEPALPYLTEDTVCICPDGILNNLPFEALAKDGRRLVEDFAIFYAPSASVLKLCMDRNRDACESILALGNPNLQNPAFRLFNAETEVSALEQFFPRADVYTADAATETIVKERAPAYDVLHFACHGELNLDDPMLTSLRLAPDTQNDGYFHAGEIFDLDLNASLVVLSACNTALGELSTGNELMGLPRSFLYAGAPAIVASLWTVDDRSTSLLMQRFYENLGSMNKAQALRHAKLDVMKEYPNPFYWAAFCLQGDYR